MLKLLLGDPNARKLKRYQPLVSDINLLEEDIAPLTDEELRSRTLRFKTQLEAVTTPAKQRQLLDDLLPEFFTQNPDHDTLKHKLLDVRSRLNAVAKERVAMWEKVRPGIATDTIQSLYKTYLDNLDRIPAQAAEHGTLTVHFFLPDQYSLQTVRIFIRYADKASYEKVAEGVFKEMRTFDCFFARLFLISKDRTPTDLKIETLGFGGQGFTFFEVENQTGRFVPSQIHDVHGVVTDPENLLTPDWNWTFAGERNTRECFFDPERGAAIHGFEVTLKSHD